MRRLLTILTGAFMLLHAAETIELHLQPGEKIWSGVIKEGHKMPLSGRYEYDLYANNRGNQVQPLLLSNQGLYVWSEEPYKFEIRENRLLITDPYRAAHYGREGKTLRDVRDYASRMFFPPSGKMPDPLLFSAPQYNTWIELTYHQNQADILKYALTFLDHGFPPGVLMIDDTWQEDYGIWKFHPGRFPDPESMIRELHDMGFRVMLWVVPFVSADQYLVYNELRGKKAFLVQKEHQNDTYETARHPAMIRWWNGVSASLDFTNPHAVEWFSGQLDRMVAEYKVDGFKLDAGDMQHYPAYALSKETVTPNRHCELYTRFGLRFPLNEYRACWKMAGQPLAQRLHDKSHTWEDLALLIPHMALEGLVGYTFSCADMIGGGQFTSFLNEATIDQDLVVRSAQCHALMPMMQFSAAPWRILDETHLKAVQKSVDLRMEFTPLIMELARKSAKTGEPIVCNMEYYFPNQGLEHVPDQFMLGDDVLVAPMIQKGDSRQVMLPQGRWKGDDGEVYEGGKTYTVDVPLDRLPYFVRE